MASAVKPRKMSVHVRPKTSLMGNAFGAIMLSTSPIFAVMYWFTASRGGTPLVVVAHAVVITVGLLLLWRQLIVFCAVTDDELIGNGIFTALVRVPLASIDRVQLVPTYLGAAPEPVLQLLVTDAAGRRLFRMRGNFWHTHELRALAHALPVPVEEPAAVLTQREFFTAHPGAAYVFENRRWLLVAVVILGVLAGSAAVVGIMVMLGLPVRAF
jgi:hypothetical protein